MKLKIQSVLNRYLGRYGEPAPDDVNSAVEHVWQKLKPETDQVETVKFEGESRNTRYFPIFAAAATVLIVAFSIFLVRGLFITNTALAMAEVADGSLVGFQTGQSLRDGEVLRSAETGAVLAMSDGSHVEMRAQSALLLERAGDGIKLRLDRGGLLITAAKQGSRHLYVQTKDVTVSVVGTVFLVNAEEAGSRVAVIQGVVEVQEGAMSKKLLPGQQVATGSSLNALPLSEEISWSRNAPAHLAMLQQNTGPVTAAKESTPAPRLRFEVASIRPRPSISPDGNESLGFVCHGVDGVQRTASEFIGREGRISSPLGRCFGRGVFIRNLIAFANRVPPRDVAGAPDWSYQIEALSDDPATVTAEQLREMVRTLLADRFKLKTHREMKDSSGFALVVAKGGPKSELKEVSDGLELSPTQEVNSAGQPILKGRSTLDKLAQWLGGSLGGVAFLSGPVVDKTGLKGMYEYEFVTVRQSGGGPRGGPPAGQLPRSQAERMADAQKQIAETMSDLMEEHLGLRLQTEKSIPVESIVIDQIEMPTEN
jgi:uncharacterized protein (TIGR03435 family)